MDRADAGVVERRSGARLTPEPLQCGAAVAAGFGKQLDRDMPAKLLVDRFIHHAHTALTKAADDFVMTKETTRGQFLHSPILHFATECSKRFF
jgi:hypothetical protein